MKYNRVIISHILLFFIGITLIACGGGSGSIEQTTNIDRPIFDRESATKSPNDSPSGNITDTTPAFTWQAIDSASEYQFGHEDTNTATNWYEYNVSPIQAHCDDTCAYTPTDFEFSIGEEKAWWVRAKTDGKWGDWSDAHIFQIIPPPTNVETVPRTISPVNEVNNITPEFSWTYISHATEYQFGFENPNTGSDWRQYNVTPIESDCVKNGDICTFRPIDSDLSDQDIRKWWVRALIDGVWAEWSSGSEFSIQDNTIVERPFIIIVKGYDYRNNPIKDFVINTNPNFTYNYHVDCDSDGILEGENISSHFTCVYDDISPNFEEHTLSISGQFPSFYQPRSYDPPLSSSGMIFDVVQWGSQEWQSMERAFAYTSLTAITATDSPDLSQVISMHKMFDGSSYFNHDISAWDVSNITDMSSLFLLASNFNQDISAWDVSNVSDMSHMFSQAKDFNQDLNAWNVSNVTDMSHMFSGANSFNNGIGAWDVGKVTNMSFMFNFASNFNHDISAWDVGNVANLSWMFNGARMFNSSIGTWDVGNVTDMGVMFQGAISFNQNIGTWDVSKVRNMDAMLSYTRKFNQDISAWDVSNVTDMRAMFAYESNFNQDISAWDVSNVRDMSNMFSGETVFDQDISTWNISNVIRISGMFDSGSLSSQNYDNLLLAWSQLTLTPSLSFSVGNTQYSVIALTARNNIINQFGWRISDGGLM